MNISTILCRWTVIPVLAIGLTLMNAQSAEAQLRRLCAPKARSYHSRSQTPHYDLSTRRLEPLEKEEFVRLLLEQTAAAKAAFRPLEESDLLRCRRELFAVVFRLKTALQRDGDRERLLLANEQLKLDRLYQSLEKARNGGEFEPTVVDETARELNADQDAVRWPGFGELRGAIRKYRTLESVKKLDEQKAGGFEARYHGLCDMLPKYVEQYALGTDPAYGATLSSAILWLDDLGESFLPESLKVTALLRRNLSRKNFYLTAGADLIAAGFSRSFDEPFDINDRIAGTHVYGSGTTTGETKAELVPSRGSVEIRILLEAAMNSQTIGRNGPVTLQTDTSGTIRAAKSVCITAPLIRSSATSARADLKSDLSNIRINGGCVVRCVAKNQIAERRPESEAAGRRRAEQRLAERFNEEVDPKIAELNENYQNKVREPLKKFGILPKVWDLATSREAAFWSLDLTDGAQPSAPLDAPEALEGCDLSVRIHQSMLNNLAAATLAGRRFEEEKVLEDLKKQFGKLPKALQRETDQAPWILRFAPNLPITVTFQENVLKVVIRIDEFESGDTVYRGGGLDVTLSYRIREKDGTLFFERAEPHSVYQRDQKRLSGPALVVNRIIVTRLNNIFPETIEAKPNPLGGAWEGKGSITPVRSAAASGWFSLGWSYDPTDKAAGAAVALNDSP